MPRLITNTKWYGWNAPEGAIQQTKRRMLLWAGINVILSLASGLVRTGVTRHNWVSFAATAALVALSVEIIGIVRFCRAKEQMYQREFEGIDHFIRLSCLFHIILTGAAVIAAIVSCFQNWTGWLDLLVLLGLAGTGACSWLTVKTYKAMPTFEMENPS